MTKELTKAFEFASFSKLQEHNIKKFEKPDLLELIIGLLCGRNTQPGLNLIGKCRNKDCLRYDKEVICPLGYGKYHLAYQIKNSPCPLCDKNLKKVHTALFYQCQLLGQGQKAKEGDETDDDSDREDETVYIDYLHNKQGEYFIFGELQSEVVLWNYLILKSSKPGSNCPENHGLEKLKPVKSDWQCNKCSKSFDKDTPAKSCRKCDYDLCYECV